MRIKGSDVINLITLLLRGNAIYYFGVVLMIFKEGNFSEKSSSHIELSEFLFHKLKIAKFLIFLYHFNPGAVRKRGF